MKKYFKDWNFKKHFTFVTAVYAVLYTIDLTLGYLLAKKVINNDTLKK